MKTEWCLVLDLLYDAWISLILVIIILFLFFFQHNISSSSSTSLNLPLTQSPELDGKRHQACTTDILRINDSFAHTQTTKQGTLTLSAARLSYVSYKVSCVTVQQPPRTRQ